MRPWICLLVFLLGCTDSEQGSPRMPLVEITGRLSYPSLDEASGLAYSRRTPGLLWAINDDGPPALYGLGTNGSARGIVAVRGARHRDWEDISAFELDGVPYLLIADVGDNGVRRKSARLYIVEEPAVGSRYVSIAWQIAFTYPDGPRDAEAVAVDAGQRRIFVLSKKDIPARLYDLPLRPKSDRRVTAEFLGVVDSLPQPQRNDLEAAKLTDNRYWQPTSMAISKGGDAAIILTYGSIFFFPRSAGQAWSEALGARPLGLGLGRLKNAEAITFSSDGRSAWLTTERLGAPLVRIDLGRIRKR